MPLLLAEESAPFENIARSVRVCVRLRLPFQQIEGKSIWKRNTRRWCVCWERERDRVSESVRGNCVIASPERWYTHRHSISAQIPIQFNSYTTYFEILPGIIFMQMPKPMLCGSKPLTYVSRSFASLSLFSFFLMKLNSYAEMLYIAEFVITRMENSIFCRVLPKLAHWVGCFACCWLTGIPNDGTSSLWSIQRGDVGKGIRGCARLWLVYTRLFLPLAQMCVRQSTV